MSISIFFLVGMDISLSYYLIFLMEWSLDSSLEGSSMGWSSYYSHILVSLNFLVNRAPVVDHVSHSLILILWRFNFLGISMIRK